VLDFADIQSHLASDTAHSSIGQGDEGGGEEAGEAAVPMSTTTAAEGGGVDIDADAPAPPPGYDESIAAGSSASASVSAPTPANIRVSPPKQSSPTKRSNSGGGSSAAANANKATALALKDQGNVKFSARQFKDAIALYTRAIKICPTLPTLYSNRAAAHLMCGTHVLCIADSEKVIRLDPTLPKGYVRKAKAQLEMDSFREAVGTLLKGREVIGSGRPGAATTAGLREINEELARVTAIVEAFDNAKKMIAAGKHAEASGALGRLLPLTNAIAVLVWTAKAALGLGKTDQAMRLTLQVLRRDKTNVLGLALRSHAMYLSEHYDDAIKLAREALRLDPDNTDAKACFKTAKKIKAHMNEVIVAGQQRDFNAVKKVTTAVLNIGIPESAPLFANLYALRGNAFYRLKEYEDALRDCVRAVYVKDDCKDAWLTKRLTLHALGRHADALKDMQSLMERWGQNDSTIRHACHKAEFELRKSKRPDYYRMMGCKKTATEGEIKAAYRSKALILHPDKQQGKSEADKKTMEEAFKTLGHALEILTTPMQRQLYDEGYDREAIIERAQAAQRAAHKDGGHGHGH